MGSVTQWVPGRVWYGLGVGGFLPAPPCSSSYCGEGGFGWTGEDGRLTDGRLDPFCLCSGTCCLQFSMCASEGFQLKFDSLFGV